MNAWINISVINQLGLCPICEHGGGVFGLYYQPLGGNLDAFTFGELLCRSPLYTTSCCLVAPSVKGVYLKSMMGAYWTKSYQHTDKTTTARYIKVLLHSSDQNSTFISELKERSGRITFCGKTNLRRLADDCVISSHRHIRAHRTPPLIKPSDWTECSQQWVYVYLLVVLLS